MDQIFSVFSKNPNKEEIQKKRAKNLSKNINGTQSEKVLQALTNKNLSTNIKIAEDLIQYLKLIEKF